jgi:uncharacterized protein YdbL (DUF1318 family)
MWPLTRSLSVLYLGALLTLAAACTGNGAGLTTASVDATAARPPASGISQLTRPVEVATAAACAKAYGYSVDPTRLRETYLSYESKQGASREQLRAIEQSYDATYQQIAGPQSSSCSRMDAATVKADVQRYASGYFAPRAPPPKEVFDVNKVWADQECGGRC